MSAQSPAAPAEQSLPARSSLLRQSSAPTCAARVRGPIRLRGGASRACKATPRGAFTRARLPPAPQVILYVFAVECVIKIVAEAEKPQRYFHSGWNNFDFVIVLGSLETIGIDIGLPGGSMLKMLRLLRLLRVLKLVKSLPQLQVIVTALIMGLNSIFFIAVSDAVKKPFDPLLYAASMLSPSAMYFFARSISEGIALSCPISSRAPSPPPLWRPSSARPSPTCACCSLPTRSARRPSPRRMRPARSSAAPVQPAHPPTLQPSHLPAQHAPRPPVQRPPRSPHW